MFPLLAPLLGALGTAKGISAAGSLIGGLAGLKAANRKEATPAQNLLSQAEGATAASEKYGINRLTMLQYGQTAGAVGGGGGGPSPLASIEMITGGLAGVADIVAGKSAQKAAQARFRSDLNTLAVDQTRSGVVASIPRYARSGFSTPSPLGGNTATVFTTNGRVAPSSNASLRSPSVVGVSARSGADALRPLQDRLDVDPRRPVDNQDIKTTSGVMVVDNPDLPFNIEIATLDGDEALQWYDWPTLAFAGGYAAAKHYANLYGSGDPNLDGSISVDRVAPPTPEQTAYLRRKWPPKPPVYSGRSDYGMPRRRQTAMGVQPY